MLQIIVASNTERNPARIWHPLMLFRQMLIQQRIPDRAWKGNINNPAGMNMPDFCPSVTELSTSKSVRVHRNFEPRAYVLFKGFHVAHDNFGCRGFPVRFTREQRD